jgi:hypothetical protein
VHPNGSEVCDAANRDEDCDGVVEDADPSAGGKTTFYADSDGDLYGAGGGSLRCDANSSFPVSNNSDCNDNNIAINPGTSEICDDSNIDEDCDGDADNDDAGATGKTDFYVDSDGDDYGTGTAQQLCDPTGTYSATVSTDCDDGNPNISPGDPEVCDPSSTDEDCNGVADDADSGVIGKINFYTDSDADGYGTGTPVLSACHASGGLVPLDGDCNESDAAYHPNAPETRSTTTAMARSASPTPTRTAPRHAMTATTTTRSRIPAASRCATL